jgi:hypothetical protein
VRPIVQEGRPDEDDLAGAVKTVEQVDVSEGFDILQPGGELGKHFHPSLSVRGERRL